MDRIRNRWLKTLKTAGSGSAASSDKIVVDIGMVGLIYFFTLCAFFSVTGIWLMEMFWNKFSNNTKVGGKMAENVRRMSMSNW